MAISCNYPRVTHILSAAGVTDFSKINPAVLEAAAKFGTAVHRACELWDNTNLNMSTLSAPLVPYLDAWIKFKKDYKIESIIAIEKKVVSERWRYQGTLDRLAEVNRKLTLIDIKTSTDIQPVTGIQLAGYALACKEMGQKIKQRWCVQLLESGYKVTKFEDKTDEAVFIACLQLAQWKGRNVK